MLKRILTKSQQTNYKRLAKGKEEVRPFSEGHKKTKSHWWVERGKKELETKQHYLWWWARKKRGKTLFKRKTERMVSGKGKGYKITSVKRT